MQGDQFQLVFALGGEVCPFPPGPRRKRTIKNRCRVDSCPILLDTTQALDYAVELLDDQAFLAWKGKVAWARRSRFAVTRSTGFTWSPV